MTTRLVLLGLLRERPLYGYEIKQIIETHMEDWTSIAFGSIYFALDKLTSQGFLENIGVEQPGSRPSRNIYQITDAGRDEFLRLLRETWRNVERQYFSLDIAIFFLGALPISEVRAYLSQRAAALQGALQHIAEHQKQTAAEPEVPLQAAAIFRHSLMHTQAELAWTQEVLAQIEAGAYG
ncbi:MAG: PadR family transcriptional regulator [Anaerolineales bacterium]|nr:PadR family transcriptional regulator [Anaerolineales bacterium]